MLSHARIQEYALITTAIARLAESTGEGEPFVGPSIAEFFPPVFLFEGTLFEIDRMILVRFVAVAALILLFWLGTRKMRVVPTRFQSIIEYGLDFVRVNVANEVLGEKDGKRFLPLLTTIFFMVLFMNFTGILPLMNLAGTSRIGVPVVLAIVAYIAFIYAGVRKSPKNFFKNSLFPAGVPKPLYLIVTPIEFFSTFVLRPITLTLRLTFNLVAGHLLLVLFFSATHWFLLSAPGFFKLFGIGTFAFGFAFTLFEILVAFLQAYIFVLLTAVYIQLALAEEH